MKHKQLVSLIVPVYQVSEYLFACLSSIQKQTYSAIEVIIVDDGSTDGSGAIADHFSEKDNRFCFDACPDVCPVCDHPQSYFEVNAENY